MLNVPDDIKELLHRDSCKKNIRIVFPNKERSDICNDLIVKDSVSFTESLCSQDTLKFGLCEAAQFECETVGVGNIKGATIKVFCEIFCDSSVTDALWQTDLQAWVYQIPYGTFIVNSCDRQADMIHRKIVSYGINSLDIDITKAFEWNKFNVPLLPKANYTVSAFYFIYACLDERVANTNLFDVVDQPISNVPVFTQINLPSGARYEISGSEKMVHQLGYSDFTGTEFYLIEADENRDIELYREKWNEDLGESIDKVRNLTNISGIHDNGTGITNTCIYKGEHKMPVMIFSSLLDDIRIPVSANIKYYDENGNLVFADYTFQDIYTNISVKKMTLKQDYSYLLDQNLTFYAEALKSKAGTYGILRYPELDLFKMFGAFAELMGMYGYTDRNEMFRFINIKQQFNLLPSNTLYPSNSLYPGADTGGKLLPNDYQTCWYNDDYTKPFGAIRCKYKNTSNVDCVYVLYLTGFSENTDPGEYLIYDLSGNYFIDADTWTDAEILTILQRIATNIEGVTYMPVEFVGRGLPYVEAGDTFEILTKSNDSITTIVLNRTLTGEITLTDTYKST